MAWARDKNGKEVWLDESGVLPPMAREELDRPMPLPDWVQERNRRNPPGVKVPEGFTLETGNSKLETGNSGVGRQGPVAMPGAGRVLLMR